MVTKTVFNQTSEETGHIEIRPFVTVPAKVGVSLGRTINLGNYESARISVTMEVPCYREEMIRLYPKIFKHVANLLSDEVGKITRQVTSGDPAQFEEVL